MPDDFECRQCEGASVTFPREAREGAHVTCRRCGAPMATISEFRHRLDARAARQRGQMFSGC